MLRCVSELPRSHELGRCISQTEILVIALVLAALYVGCSGVREQQALL